MTPTRRVAGYTFLTSRTGETIMLTVITTVSTITSSAPDSLAPTTNSSETKTRLVEVDTTSRVGNRQNFVKKTRWNNISVDPNT